MRKKDTLITKGKKYVKHVVQVVDLGLRVRKRKTDLYFLDQQIGKEKQKLNLATNKKEQIEKVTGEMEDLSSKLQKTYYAKSSDPVIKILSSEIA